MVSRLVLKSFPVQVALGAWILYLVTLAHGVTLFSLELTGATAGWNYASLNNQPLFWLLTLPVRWLPAGWIPLALNLFSATCAAAALGILAASLERAPWDRPLASLPGGWSRVPLLLGVVVCGLEFSFWQSATQATGESLQVLLLAAALWCLFKYPYGHRRRWFRLAAFIWGLGMADNWMMLITLPLFVASLIWLAKTKLLNLRLLVQLALAGLAGFSLVALLPLVHALAPHSTVRLGGALWQVLRDIRHLIYNFYLGLWRGQPLAVLAAIVYFLLPVLPALIRKRDLGTKKKAMADRQEIWLYRFSRLVLLAACLWLALDPKLGLRQILREQTGLHVPLLSFDYLLGLGAAFLAGNLMLSLDLEVHAHRRRKRMIRKLSALGGPAMAGALGIMSVGLLCRNAPAIAEANRHPLQEFGEAALQNLPSGGGVVFSDDALRLASFEAAATAKGQAAQWLSIDTGLLPQPEYRRWLADKYPGRWGLPSSQDVLGPDGMRALLDGLRAANQVYYLHPSFGPFFERYYLQPQGMAQRLSRFADRSIDPPPMTADTIRETELSWEWARSRLDALTEAAAARPSAVTRVLYAGLGLEPVSEPQVHLLCQWFSVALDDWGVQLQRAGQLDAANKRFQQALDLNTNNLAARLNYRCNTNLAAANHPALEDLSSLTSAMTSRKTFRDVFMACGPVDEASFCFYAGGDFRKAGLARQALQQFERAAALAGDRPAPLLALAHTYVECGFEPQARDTILHLRTLGSGAATNAWLDANLSLLEAASWQESTNLAEMQKVLARVLDKYPDEATVDLAEQIYLSAGDFTNALKLAEKKLAAKPDDAHSLLRQAGIFVRMGDFSQSLATLNRVLGLTNSTEAHFLRGAVLAKTDQLDEAAKDFEQAANTAGFQVESQLGLAQIALRQHDTNAAVSRLTLAWKGAPENSAKRQSISRLLNQLMTR